MGSKPKAPAPINVQEVAGAQNTQNTQNAQQQAAYNRPNQTNQFGSQSQWRQTGTDANGNPTFEQSQTLGGEGQQFASGFSGLGQQYIQGAGQLMANNPDFSSSDAYDRALSFAQPALQKRYDRQRELADTKLKNQGFSATDEGYTSAMGELAEQQDAGENALVSGIQGQLFNQGIQGDQQNVNRLQQLGQTGANYGNQAINSGFANVPGVNVQNVDLTSLYNQQQQQLQQNYQNELNSYNGMLGGIAGLGGTIAGAALGGPFGASLGGSLFGGSGQTTPGTLANGGWSTTTRRY